jgi:hypothetical protein
MVLERSNKFIYFEQFGSLFPMEIVHTQFPQDESGHFFAKCPRIVPAVFAIVYTA